ncbi:MAG: tetratricopeptide repeat protein [Polyangiaceae bacterium]
MSSIRRSLRWSPLLVSLASLTLLAPTTAHAQTAADRATARELGQDGQAALDKKDYTTAEDRFRRADALFHAPTLLLGYARAEAGLGKVVNASEAYNRIVREGVPPGAPAVFAQAVEAAKAEAGAVQARIASVTITVAGPENPTVTLDDQPVPVAALGVKRPVDPGEHVVKATGDGWQPSETKFTVADAGNANANLTLLKVPGSSAAAATPAPAGQPAPAASGGTASADTGTTSSSGSTQRTVGIVGIAAGVVGLGVGAVTGILAIGKHSTLSTECPDGTCSSAQSQSDLSSYHSIGMVSTIGFVAGGVLAAGGAVIFLTAPHGQSAAPKTGVWITPFVGPGSVGAVGRF